MKSVRLRALAQRMAPSNDRSWLFRRPSLRPNWRYLTPSVMVWVAAATFTLASAMSVNLNKDTSSTLCTGNATLRVLDLAQGCRWPTGESTVAWDERYLLAHLQRRCGVCWKGCVVVGVGDALSTRAERHHVVGERKHTHQQQQRGCIHYMGRQHTAAPPTLSPLHTPGRTASAPRHAHQ
jgi:hypothetical protein